MRGDAEVLNCPFLSIYKSISRHIFVEASSSPIVSIDHSSVALWVWLSLTSAGMRSEEIS